MPMDSKDNKDNSEVKIFKRHEKTAPIHKNKNFLASFEFALQGFKTVFREERNMRKHGVVAVLAILAGFVFKLPLREWLWLGLSIFLVLVVEIINTCFENMVDLATGCHFDPIGKKVKDMAAAAVLLTAGFAVLVGCILFLPKLWMIFKNMR